MIKEFYKDSKKVSNNNMKKKLKIKLIYPTYKHGLRNIFNNLKLMFLNKFERFNI